MLSHRALMHNYVSNIVAFSLHERETTLSALPLYHSAPMHCMVLPHLAVGAQVVILEDADPEQIVHRIEQDAITGFLAVPTLWATLLEQPSFARADLSSLRKAYYGASIMPRPVLDRLSHQLAGAGLYQGFGQSEMGPLTAVLLPHEHAERPTSAGRPVLFVEMRVVDDEMRDVPVGEPGEAVYRSPQACLGYWQKPEETDEAFAGGWFHSGDLVTQDDEGYVYVVDRIKDVINTGGVLVSSRDVEDALLLHPAVRDVAVIATPHPKWVEAITAFVVRGSDLHEAALLAHARHHLSGYKVPKAVQFVEELPRNGVGKVLKRELRAATR
jgi:fatty-acyl-CoA synthase